MTSPILLDDLDTQLCRLSLPTPPTKFSEELEEIGLVIFRPVCSLGYFTWRPDDGGKTIRYEKLDAITAQDIIESKRLDMNGLPPTLNITKVRMPYTFSSSPDAASFDNKFPYGQLECVHLHAATKRGVDWNATDFCIGGSVLSMLADRCITTDPYFCCKIPHTAGAVLVAKCKDYTADRGDVGHQFERLVTGSLAGDSSCDIEFTEHLQLMKVGTFDVLFRAEVDSMSGDTGQPIEITASNPRYRGTKLMLQMISSGSTVLCEGTKSRGSLVKITTRSLASVASDAINDRSHLKRLETNILLGLSEIQTQLEGVADGHAHKIIFVGSKLQLEPIRTGAATSLLPNDTVMKALLTNSNTKIAALAKEKIMVTD
jgi:hypothetical protein